jgi:hypothetical protein
MNEGASAVRVETYCASFLLPLNCDPLRRLPALFHNDILEHNSSLRSTLKEEKQDIS